MGEILVSNLPNSAVALHEAFGFHRDAVKRVAHNCQIITPGIGSVTISGL